MRIREENRLAKKSIAYFGTRHAQPGSFATAATAPRVPQESAQRDDVVFVSSKDSETSTLWVNYLTACFEQISRQQGRPPFRVAQVTFEEPQSSVTDARIRNSRLQIVVVCPVFLERVAERPEQAAGMTRQLGGERVLAMMLGVQDAHLTIAQRSSLLAYDSWRKFFVKDQDETFVGQFLGAAVAILGNPTLQQNPTGTGTIKSDKIGFSVHPKKVKMGQNRILALLNEPLTDHDNVTVTVDRCGEALEIGHVKRRNPYTLQFAIPERCLDVSMLIGVRITRNGTPLGVRQVKCESRLRELDQILRAHDNPLEFMCQTFGFNPGDKEQLDNWMVHAFQKNVPPHFNLLSSPPGEPQLAKNHSSSEENPTLLHFAARFGLEKLAWQLLECPGAEIACDMRNVNDAIPADLAEQAGHVRLAHQLRGYMQMNEFSNMYSYLKVMSESNDGQADQGQEDYCRPRPMSEAYSVPPVARPVLPRSFPDYSTPPPPQYCPDAGSNASTPAMPIYASTSTLNASSLDLQSLRSPTDSVTPTPECKSRSSGSSAKSQEPQDELLEIITDFKNNVFTISEVERLVENWRNRNDVQQSFKDKQRQLSAMRDEYERIQKRMKDDMRASSTPFDRIRKFFSSSSSSGAKATKKGESSKESTAKQGNLAERRPVSSLSLHSVSSSSSSGRMSAVSGCSGASLGDSGTHSDTEDRRLQHQISGDEKTVVATPSAGSCYEVPPAPKPYNTEKLYNGLHSSNYQQPRLYSPANVVSELDPRPVKSSYPTADDKEYYIAFPPSGLPVHSFKGAKEPATPTTPVDMKSNYVNLTPPPFAKENVLTVQPEIHAEPEDDDDDDDDLPLPPPPPPPLEEEDLQPDYSNIQTAASDDIARNFGITLKKLPPPPVPPRTEFSLSSSSAEKVE